jgi:hypothetical protein
MLQEVSSREKFDYVPQDEKNSVSDAALALAKTSRSVKFFSNNRNFSN